MTRFFSGTDGRVILGTTEIEVTGWSATETIDLVETTHAASAGFKTYLEGPKSIAGKIEFFWDSEQNPLAPPLGLAAGNRVQLSLCLHKSAATALDVPEAIVKQVALNSQVGGVFHCSAQFQSSGSYTLPAESF